MHKLLSSILLTILSGFALTACQSTVFGLSQSTWKALTPAQQQQIINGYIQQQQINAQNAPLINAINTAGSLINMSTMMDGTQR